VCVFLKHEFLGFCRKSGSSKQAQNYNLKTQKYQSKSSGSPTPPRPDAQIFIKTIVFSGFRAHFCCDNHTHPFAKDLAEGDCELAIIDTYI
jgi:hypothetical protein